jgi:hypothetical protein
VSDRALVHPLFVGKANAELVVGRSWRATQDLARLLGVKPRRAGRIAVYLATELVEAIARQPVEEPGDPGDVADGSELESLRRRLGKRRRR